MTFDRDIDPDELAIALRVLDKAQWLDTEDEVFVSLRRACGKFYKEVKKNRRRKAREETAEHDKAVIAATATGSPSRIDDETAGVPLQSAVTTTVAGTLKVARSCYICKNKYTVVDSFYHQLCPECAAFSHAKRDARTDLTGKRALLTGGRAKIGMYVALRLLRDGAHTTITTRFPHDAARRFAQAPDYSQWSDRLTIVGIDLRDPAQVMDLADQVAAAGPLDILINNAAQTVKRSQGAYDFLVQAEAEALPSGLGSSIMKLGPSFGQHPEILAAPARALEGATTGAMTPAGLGDIDAMVAQALTMGSADMERIDAGGLIPDQVDTNSWVQHVDEVTPLELLEVQLCNSVAPFILVSRLRPAMAAAAARRKYVVNVSAMEGQFSRGYKGPGHPHTNMAKAALNMLTRTSAQEMFETDRICMSAVDTGWITDERPHETKIRLAEEGFKAPLDLVDGAARIYDPIVMGESGTDFYGCFLKDYRPSAW